MAPRRIGREVMQLGTSALRPTSVDAIHAVIGWEPMARALASLYPSAMGEKAWPPLAMFKALVPGTVFCELAPASPHPRA